MTVALSPEEILVARLKTTNAVSALTSNRVYPLELPQSGSLPAIVYVRDGTTFVNGSTVGSATREATITIRCCASSYAGAKALASAVRGDAATGNALQNHTDANGNVWHLVEESDDPGPIQPGTEQFEDYGILQTYRVWFDA